VLFEALGTQAIEINAQLPVRQFYPLLMGLDMPGLNLQNPNAMQMALSQIQLDAHVSLVGYENANAKWQGELLRIGESIDPDRDTLDLVVAVNNPYAGVIPGSRPPLLKGMYASVEFFTFPRDLLVLPRKAIHQGRVYVAKANKLDTGYEMEIRPLNILHKQGQLVVVDDSVKEGEKIIITDVIPVIKGLPLNPVVAEEYETQLARDAAGIQDINLNDNNTKSQDNDNQISPNDLPEGTGQ
ncbi:MAG: HlyD family secretion protein, partial [Gammaproteobacteria bacterium]|nr:HlyD family secretion protein [Gammaproteobacteria bacterium]